MLGGDDDGQKKQLAHSTLMSLGAKQLPQGPHQVISIYTRLNARCIEPLPNPHTQASAPKADFETVFFGSRGG